MKKHIAAAAVIVMAVMAVMTMFFHASSTENVGNHLRFPATNFVRVLHNRDVPGIIEDLSGTGYNWSMRRTAASEIYNPAFIMAVQFIMDVPAILRNGPDERQDTVKSGHLAPVLAQDGASPPHLYASLPGDYGDALDWNGQPLRWRVPEYIISGYRPFRGYRSEPQEQEAAPVPIPRIANLSPSEKAGHYRGIVENFSRRYNLNPDLVMAIIHTESDFSPTLVSGKQAMGLMQLLPSTASDEVHRFLYGRRGQVSFEELRVPETNIKYGTAYLHILINRYFPEVKDREVQEYCAVASYNMGPNRFLRLYGSNNEQAVAKINSMSAEEFYQDLFSRVPARETRFFVEKVRRMKQYYTSAQ